jgi:hypothetical protein
MTTGKHNRFWLGSIGVLGLSGVALIGLLGCQEPNANQPPAPEPVTELWGLTVGMTKADVSQAKGKPTQAAGSSMVYSSTEQGDKQLHYVTFDDQGALRNVCTSRGNLQLFGLKIGHSESQLLAKLGPPKMSRHNDDEVSKRVYYPRYGTNFGIDKGAINLICIGQSYRENAALTDENSL